MTPAEKRKRNRLKLRQKLCKRVKPMGTISVALVSEIVTALIEVEKELEDARKGRAPATNMAAGAV